MADENGPDLQYALTLAAVTAILKNLLSNSFSDCRVNEQIGSDIEFMARPLDMIETGGVERARVNVFMYAVTPSSGIANALQGPIRPDSPTEARRWEPLSRDRTPLPPRAYGMDLHYLITASAPRDTQSEVMLGYCAAILRQFGSLEGGELQGRLERLSTSDVDAEALKLSREVTDRLGTSLRRLCIMPQFLGMDEMSKLWAMFQARYRPSLGYRATHIQLTAPVPGEPASERTVHA
ncbi:MAG TPA: DUF4255 domain-containing protein [Chthonomonadaceae bacterium]|nr:DUF4255 domain-containing protein [Chthonomonadaceae bacterium]